MSSPNSMIPIQNLYFMLCYAWGYLSKTELTSVGHEENVDILNLFAIVLTRGFFLLRKRGLYRSYIEVGKETRRIRGKIGFQQSLPKLLHEQGKMYCCFDELSNNVLPNQILKSTFLLLYRYKDLDKELREEITECIHTLQFVDAITLTPRVFTNVNLPGSFRLYQFLLRISRFIVENQLVNQEEGTATFATFNDEKQMYDLFEEFLRSFYQWELRKIDPNVYVKKKTIKWLFDTSSSHLPEMETDLSFQYRGKHFIIDAKYYTEMFQPGWNGTGKNIRSGHLYQVYAYIKNWEHHLQMKEEQSYPIHGMLIYPVAEGRDVFQETYTFENHYLTVASINFNQPSNGIRKDLLALVEEKPDLLT
jgi:5-methylcytosine-specific restriction enzyme subunit McrC